MSEKIQPKSLLDDIAVEMDKVASEKKPAPARKRTRTKVKPYEALKAYGADNQARKAEKKAVKANGKAPAKSALKTSPKKVETVSKKKVAKPASKENAPAANTTVAKGGETCSVCHKKLTRGTSIQNGMGPECARQVERLPQGVSLEQHYESLIVTEEPKGYIKLREAFEIAKKKGVSVYRFMIAVGGNRATRPPLNDNFKMVFYKGARWVPKASVSDKELKALK